MSLRSRPARSGGSASGAVRDMWRAAAARAPGTCGELVQGWLNGRLLQVTCPVDLYVRARVQLGSLGAGWDAPPGSEKAGEAVRRVIQRTRAGQMGGRLVLESPLPRGKGMGSSTADMLASAAAAAAVVGHDLDADALADLALSMEPSDGTMFPGLALFDHREGRVRETLGPALPLRILVVDPGGIVDTQSFNRCLRRRWVRRRPASRELEAWATAFYLVREGVRTGDIEAVGRGATVSAVAHQPILANALFPEILQVAREVGAVGVNVAHSGTVAGLLFPSDGDGPDEARERLAEGGAAAAHVLETRLVSGGVDILPADPGKTT